MRLFCTTLLVLSALLLSAGSPFQPAPPELTNPGFENGDLANWEMFGPGWRVSNHAGEGNRDSHEGTWGVVNDVAPTDEDEWRGIIQKLPSRYRKQYSVSCWVRLQNVEDSEVYLEVYFLDKKGEIIESQRSEALSADTDFIHLEISHIMAPKKTREISVRGIVHMLAAPRETGYHVFDDFEVTELD